MVVEILVFGIAKDIIGKKVLTLTVEDITTVKKLKTILRSSYPKLNGISNFLVAVNSKYAKDSQKIDHKDEIAIIPPTNGG